MAPFLKRQADPVEPSVVALAELLVTTPFQLVVDRAVALVLRVKGLP